MEDIDIELLDDIELKLLDLDFELLSLEFEMLSLSLFGMF
jgi:hypothetical protein